MFKSIKIIKWLLITCIPLVILGGFVWTIPSRLIQPSLPTYSYPQKPIDEIERIKLEDSLRKTIIQFISSLSGALFFITLWIAFQQYELTNEKQSSERFTQAINQLGNKENISIRIGGIYGLAKLAKDSTKDKEAVIDILTQYIRNYTRQDDFETAKGVAYHVSSSPGNTSNESDESDESDEIEPPPDIKATLKVLKDLIKNRNKNEEPLDLRKADLRGANLSEFNLKEANLHDCNLESAFLNGTVLVKANLTRAILKKAKMRKTKLNEAFLQQAHLEEADLRKAILIKANLEQTHLDGANMRQAELQNSNLVRATLVRAKLTNANLQNAQLANADLSNAVLNGVVWKNTRLTNTKLLNSENIDENELRKAVDLDTIER